ncbi:unnamed protein product [Merluccius merluccius]
MTGETFPQPHCPTINVISITATITTVTTNPTTTIINAVAVTTIITVTTTSATTTTTTNSTTTSATFTTFISDPDVTETPHTERSQESELESFWLLQTSSSSSSSFYALLLGSRAPSLGMSSLVFPQKPSGGISQTRREGEAFYLTFVIEFEEEVALGTASQAESTLDRTCTVEINNSCGFYALSDPGLFMVSGFCNEPLPPGINKRSQASGGFTKPMGTATGAVGVFTYDLAHHQTKDYNAVLAVMFSVPFDYNLYSNWCAAGIFFRGIECDYNLFDLLYNGEEFSFVRAKGGAGPRTYKGEVVEVSVRMSASSRAVLRVDIEDLDLT